MLKKENFVDMLNTILAQDERENKMAKALDPFLDDTMFVFEMCSNFTNTIINILEKEMEDEKDGYVSWWLYDAPHAGKCKDSCWVELETGEKIIVETPGQLYDFLTMEC